MCSMFFLYVFDAKNTYKCYLLNIEIASKSHRNNIRNITKWYQYDKEIIDLKKKKTIRKIISLWP